MASGRGWVRQQHSMKPGPAAQTLTASLPSQTPLKVQHRCAKVSSAAPEKKDALTRRPVKNKQLLTRTCPSQATYIESLPCEILLKIFSYLDPISLMSAGSVSRRFYELAKDNIIWCKIYISSRKVNQHWKYDPGNLLQKKLSDIAISYPDSGYWKRTYVKELIMAREKEMTQIMKSVKCYRPNDVSLSMQKALKRSGLLFVLTFLDGHGKETVLEQTDIYFRDRSLTVTWNSFLWPEFHSLVKIQLHGVTPVLTDKCYKPIKNGLQKLSLIAEYDLGKKEFDRLLGQDMHIKLFHLHPYLIVGMWKKGTGIAFVMGTIHYHQLLEKSFLGSACSPYTFPPHVPILDDVDPEYGLHGYQLRIDLYSGPRIYLCKTFHGLFCRKDYIKNGNLRMTAVGLWNNKHVPLAGTVSFLWKTMTLSGSIQNCFLMDVTVLDESETPYWCFSAPVQLFESKSTETLYDFMGQSFGLNYKDDIGRVYAELIWMKETEEHYMINLVLYLNTEKVNSYFGTNYTDSTG